MIDWVESQSVPWITVWVYAFCYVIAGAVFAAAAFMAKRPIAGALKASVPTMLTPISVIAALLIAFLAARVWGNVDRANTLVAQEASAIREFALLADALPAETRTSLQGAMRTYIHFVETEDFPAMSERRASSRQPPGLSEAFHTLLVFVPAGLGQQVVQTRAVSAIEKAMEARRSRIVLSRTAISFIQWLVVFILDTLILLIIAMVHLGRLTTVAINLFIFSTAFAACMVLLMVNDRPYATGGFTVRPQALREIVSE